MKTLMKFYYRLLEVEEQVEVGLMWKMTTMMIYWTNMLMMLTSCALVRAELKV